MLLTLGIALTVPFAALMHKGAEGKRCKMLVYSHTHYKEPRRVATICLYTFG